MEPMLDPNSPVHVGIVVALMAGGAVSAWLGVRDGFVRREMRTNSGLLVGSKALLAGLLYFATGVLSLVGGVVFLLRARGH
jgi:hypothetical protein